MPNVFSHPHQLDESISNFLLVGIFHFYSILKENPVSKQWRTLSDAAFAASDLVLHCLPMSHKKDARLIWETADLLALVCDV